MLGLPLSLILTFTLFGTFLFYQQKHASTFRGASQGFLALLSIWALAGFIFEMGFLLYFGYRASLWSAMKLFGLSMLLWIPLMMIEVAISARTPLFTVLLSIVGFIAMPVCGYLMVLTLP